MTLIIASIMLLGYLLIARERFINVNKTAVAVFACTVGWAFYISHGTDFIMSQPIYEHADYLQSVLATKLSAREFVAGKFFLSYLGKSCEIALLLLVIHVALEKLRKKSFYNCIPRLLVCRSSRRLLWLLTGIVLMASANLTHLTIMVILLAAIRKFMLNLSLVGHDNLYMSNGEHNSSVVVMATPAMMRAENICLRRYFAHEK